MITNQTIEEHLEDFSSFFGRSPDYYIERLNWYLTGKKYSFNIYAFFLGAYWLLYRKMYKPFMMIIRCLILTQIIIEISYSFGAIGNSLYNDFDLILIFVLSGLTGCCANNWYIRKSIKIIESTNKGLTDPIIKEQVFKKKGGTSLIGPIILIVFTLLTVVYGLTN